MIVLHMKTTAQAFVIPMHNDSHLKTPINLVTSCDTYDHRIRLLSNQEGRGIVHSWCHTERHFDNRHMSNDIQDLYIQEDRL